MPSLRVRVDRRENAGLSPTHPPEPHLPLEVKEHVMANPIALAAALSRMIAITCPYCRHKKLVERKPAAFRRCPRCHRRFEDPLYLGRKKK
jgi:hypothetical protein